MTLSYSRSRLRAKPHTVYLRVKLKPQNCTQHFWVMSVANWYQVFVTGSNFNFFFLKKAAMAQLRREDWGCFHGSSCLSFACQFGNLKKPFTETSLNIKRKEKKRKTLFLLVGKTDSGGRSHVQRLKREVSHHPNNLAIIVGKALSSRSKLKSRSLGAR